MNTFLSEIVTDLLTKYSVNELKELAIIVPSRRAGLHFKTELAEAVNKTFWAPQITSLDDYILDFHLLAPVDSIAVHFELFNCYKKLFKEPVSFDSFHSWSSQVLSDFNEIDRYLLPSETVFKNLKDIKEIEAWSFNADELTPGQEKFLEFWEKLGELYLLFNQTLEAKGFATKGRIYKEIAASPEKYLNNISNKKVIFIGFNALSKSEEIIFSYLKGIGKAEVYWDIDKYYMNDPVHEAGNFIKQYKNWNEESFKNIQNNIIQDKEITIYPANTNLNQVQIVAQILNENPAFSESKSAVILADELLLKPLINNIPLGLEKMNITMGYSISSTLSLELLDIIFSIQINSKRFLSSQAKNTIYYKDLFTFLEQVIITKFFNKKGINTEKIIRKLIKSNTSFISKKYLTELIGSNENITKLLFFDASLNTLQILDNLISFLDELRLYLISASEESIEVEVLYKIIGNLSKLKDLSNQFPYIEGIDGIRNLMTLINRTEKLSFYGEPLQGLQVMGLLESRAIDFENLIIVSCNEKYLPGIHGSNSFIPHDLKVYLGLPTKQDREAIFSYYFYRLLHRVKNVHLIYNNGLPNGLDSNEISRYLIQLKSELPLKISQRDFHFDWENKTDIKLIEKDKATLTKIDLLFEKGLSPSALNNYLSCPLDFYYKYILRINEKKELEETIESSTQGTIVHNVLEDLYRAHAPLITTDAIDQMLKSYEELTNQKYINEFPSKSFRFGKNLLYYKMALKEIKFFLLQEKKQILKKGPIEILGLEEQLTVSINIDTEQGKKKILLKGNADRIDSQNGQIRIIDYKTGYVEQKDVIAQSIEQVFERPKAAQLFFYSYLYKKLNPNSNAISGIISMRNLKDNLIKFGLNKNRKAIDIDDSCYETFEQLLIEKIQEIYSIEKQFSHNPEAKYCMLCD